MTLIILLVTSILGTVGAAKVTTFNSTPGIYFEEYGNIQLYSTNWKLVTYYNLEDFHLEHRLLRVQTKEIEKICLNFKIHKPTRTHPCESQISNIKIILRDIDQNTEILEPKHLRNRRGLINAVGSLSKTLFGTLDEEDAKHYDNQIKKLKVNEDHLLELIRSQTIIIDKTINIFNKTSVDIELEFSNVLDKFDKISQAFNYVVKEVNSSFINLELESTISAITLSLMRYQNTQKAIIDMLLDVKHGTANPLIITPFQLEEALTVIRKNLPPGTTLPISVTQNNLIDLYKVSKTSTNKVNDQIIIETKIPLPVSTTFQAYKVVPFPTIVNDSFVYIKPTTEYLLVDINREKHYPMSSEDLTKCQKHMSNTHLCRITHPILNSNAEQNQCEMRLLKHNPQIPDSCEMRVLKTNTLWIQLTNPNKWLFSFKIPITVDNICGNSIEPLYLQTSGILEISPNCYIRSDEFTLYGHSEKITISNNSYLPSINLTQIFIPEKPNLKLPKMITIKNKDHGAFFEISQDINALKNKENQKISNVDAHDIHHYSFIYIILFLAIAYYSTRAILKCIKTKSKKKEEITENQSETAKTSNETKDITNTNRIPLSSVHI